LSEIDSPTGNLFDRPVDLTEEVFTTLLARPEVTVERIVSLGQTTPPDCPYVQDHDEWVAVLAGAARVEIGGVEHALEAGDSLMIPAGAAHRVTYTDPVRPTVWIALHFRGG